MTSTFTQLTSHNLNNLGIDVKIYRHNKTGLTHYHLASDNQENALMFAFATQPTNSMGEAHILEHVVLCGSEKYPVRDPFFSMIKRSLQTFMNAFTASDWTAYPFATQNKKDFFNLLSVYSDAVFFPNIDRLDFAQEGIRLELDDKGNACYHGVVFNEMKGAMSGEIDQLYYAIAKELFPTTTYGHNSGGDPADIPNLTHQNLVDFHQKYYHPSNAIVMSFGDIAVDEIHEHLQGSLSKFDGNSRAAQSKRFFVDTEIPFTAPKTLQATYATDTNKDNTHHVIAWLLPTITDPKTRLAMRLMEGVLCEHSGLPLREFLETTDLGDAPSPLLGLDDSHYQMVFYAGLRGSTPQNGEAFFSQIDELLQKVAAAPISPETIETVLHQMELDERHIGGDSMPYGLSLMMEGLSLAIHGGNPIDAWQVDEQLAWLKVQLADPMWLPNLIKTHLIDNKHRVNLSLIADTNKTQQQNADEQHRLSTITNALTDSDKQQILADMQALDTRQATKDDVDILPKVGLEDIPSEVDFVFADKHILNINNTDLPLYQYDAGTNGLYYYQLLLDLTDNPLVYHPLMPIYLTLLSELGTHHYNAREFQAYQARHSSGVTARISQRNHPNDKDKLSSYFVLATRALNEKTEATEVLQAVLTDTIFDESDRMSELLKQRQMTWQSRIAGAGHAYAMQSACAGMATQASLEYAYSGLPALKALKQFLNNADTHSKDSWTQLSQALTTLHQQIQALPKSVILVCEASQKEPLHKAITTSLQNLPIYQADDTRANKALDALDNTDLSNTPQEFVQLYELFGQLKQQKQPDTAWLVATQVYHNAVAYPAVSAEHKDAASLMVLAVFLRNGYLHNAIREKGGAYGGGASYDSASASLRFCSYRDPHLDTTFGYFDKAIDWVINTDHHSMQLEEAILGIIASMDKPASPAGNAIKSCMGWLHGRDKAWQEQLRRRLLAVSLEDIKHVATTYLKDKAHVRATIAPIDKADTVADMGFVIHKLD